MKKYGTGLDLFQFFAAMTLSVAWSMAAIAQTGERSGKDIVDSICAKCHASGLNGAPRVGDRDAWVPRLKQGLDSAVSTAIKGHGGMPPRGNRADFTDPEIRNAILYMFNPGAASKGAASAPAKGGVPAAGGK